jgi:FixJ family two-component response regulator
MQNRAVSPPDLIVVIDDDVAVRNSLKFSLEVEGFEVHAYAEASTLLDEAELPRRGCLIIDYNLPGMNGLAALDTLRRRGVAMPASAAAAGVAIVEKPLLGSALFDAVHDAII